MFPPYFGHRVALTCFYNVREEQLRNRVALKSPRGIEEWWAPPPFSPLGRGDVTRSWAQTWRTFVFWEKRFLRFLTKRLRPQPRLWRRLPTPQSLTGSFVVYIPNLLLLIMMQWIQINMQKINAVCSQSWQELPLLPGPCLRTPCR